MRVNHLLPLMTINTFTSANDMTINHIQVASTITVLLNVGNNTEQRQTAGTAYLKNKKLLLYVFAIFVQRQFRGHSEFSRF